MAPFLTAMTNPTDIPIMLHEMATLGIAMSIITLTTWRATLTINHYMLKTMSTRFMKAVEQPIRKPTTH